MVFRKCVKEMLGFFSIAIKKLVPKTTDCGCVISLFRLYHIKDTNDLSNEDKRY